MGVAVEIFSGWDFEPRAFEIIEFLYKAFEI
jgi:hypothetical protein